MQQLRRPTAHSIVKAAVIAHLRLVYLIMSGSMRLRTEGSDKRYNNPCILDVEYNLYLGTRVEVGSMIVSIRTLTRRLQPPLITASLLKTTISWVCSLAIVVAASIAASLSHHSDVRQSSRSTWLDKESYTGLRARHQGLRRKRRGPTRYMRHHVR